MLSDADWARLDHRFEALHQEIKESGSKVHKLDGRLIALEQGASHTCDAAIKAHEGGSWAHNPYKATGLLAGIVAIWEGVRTYLHK